MTEEANFLLFILRWILKKHSEIEILESVDVFGTLLEVKVAKDDMPILIWKGWKNIDSIRNIVRQYWSKVWKKLNIKIIENN